MNIAIIGCGAIGKKRALALGTHQLSWAVDTDVKRASDIAALKGSPKISSDFNEALKDPKVEMVIVSTTNDQLSLISLAAIKARKHVLVEKPAGRDLKEAEILMKHAKENKVMVKVGFNLRYHPALIKAREIFDSGVMGGLMFMRGRYGHGGRLGYEKEWRADPKLSGGGELIDQGVHLIDLSRWFMGEFTGIEGRIATYFWQMPVEDNAFLCLTTAQNQVAWLHVSCSEWKNMFSVEIYGKMGKLQIEGLGGSYGLEKLTYYQMLPPMGPPQTSVWEFPGEDASWKLEFDAFVEAINGNTVPNGSIEDACQALKIIDKIYAEAGRTQ